MFPSFHNPKLLATALTHRSALNEGLSTSSESNERLEFLGDAVLELIISELLYRQLPTEQEGMLTALRSALVRTTSLAEVALALGLGEMLFMSKGEESTGGRQNPSLLADVFEAVVGGLYLDQGITAPTQLVETYLMPKLADIMSKKLYKDPKSHLQELVQARGPSSPEYVVVGESGPDHNREFDVEVHVDGVLFGQGRGRSKQYAQTAAAQDALEKHFYTVE